MKRSDEGTHSAGLPPAPSGDRLLILGWHAELGQAALGLGLRPVVLYGPGERNWAEPIPEPECVPVYCDDPSRLDVSMPALLRSGLTPGGFAAVCPAGEAYVIAASEYASLMGLPGLPLRTSIACRDKAVQKSLIRNAGIPCAEFQLIPDPESLVYASEKLDWDRYPAVLKPVAGVGSMSTDVVGGDADLRLALSRKDPGQLRTPHLLEQFIEAEQEWHLDGYAQQGQITFLSIGVYMNPLLFMRAGLPVAGTLLDPDEHADSFRRAHAFLGRTLDALKLTDSVFHAELFVRPGSGEFVFSECAARPAGSAIPHAVLAKHGVDLYAAHLDFWLGRPAGQAGETRARYVGYSQLNTKPGVLIDHPSVEDLMGRPGVVHASLQYPRGWSLPSSRDGTNFRMGWVVVAGHDRREMETRLRDASEWFDRNLSVGPVRTNDRPAWTLRARQPSHAGITGTSPLRRGCHAQPGNTNGVLPKIS